MTVDESRGLVFDVQRFSLDDGPGIRTTVFLQGCPLRCRWCHNPEGQGNHLLVSFRSDLCVGCGACVQACENGAQRLENGLRAYERSLCRHSGRCDSACAYGALKLSGRNYSVSVLIEIVMRDLTFYRRSGGGLTLSGGEPLNQLRFTRELLRLAKQNGLHTCLETCGEAPESAFEEVLPLVDLFLFDYKMTDPLQHKVLTGVDNHGILANLEFLYSREALIRLRCPLVAGVNDTEEHLRGIANVARLHPQLAGVELMPFHALGHHKYDRFGLADPLPACPDTPESTKKCWLATLRSLGCEAACVL